MSPDVSARVAAFDAAVRRAIEEANDDSWSYRSGFETSDVARAIDQDVSERTVRRALHDAAALGWVRDQRQKWKAGPRAEEYVLAADVEDGPDVEDVV